MTLANSLSVEDLIVELKIGKATVKFILDRFTPWFSSQLIDGSHQYSSSVIPLMIRISDLLSSGMLPSQIEEILENEIQGSQSRNSGNDVRMNQDALAFIRDMVKDIRGHQGRIAQAHEKRAQAEERKAAAIEKRAEAEEKKAHAMNNIANALQEMGRMRAVDSHTMEIAGQAAQALTMDEDITPPTELDADDLDFDNLDGGDQDFKAVDQEDLATEDPEWEDDFEDPLAGMAELLNHPEPDPAPIETSDLNGSTPNIDDLSLLVDDPGLCEQDLDDLSALINTVSETEPEELDTLLDSDHPLPELDNLAQLIDETSEPDQSPVDLDDLSILIDAPEDKDEPNTGLDDLSLLVDPDQPKAPDNKSHENLDDLSALIDTKPEGGTDKAIPMDDLSLLVDPVSQETNTGDDLWALVENPVEDKDEVTPAEPSLKPEITPDQDLAKYKAAVMKIIIELKSSGLTAKETTDRLNKDEVPTLSGKPEWREKAISKIYGFIESTQ